jgi:hypothetical protein
VARLVTRARARSAHAITAHPRTLVVYRSYRDFYQEVPEAYFRLELAPSSSPGKDIFLASLVAPEGSSIQQQLLTLHRASPRASLKVLLARVAVQRVVVDSQRCSAIRSRVEALSDLSIQIPALNVIELHPFVHRIVVDVDGAHVDATLHDTDAPVVRWALETAKAIQDCCDH